MPKLTPFSYHEVIEACEQPGCPICRWANTSVDRYIKGLIYDSVNDPPTREKIRSSMGFCYLHTWMLPEAGDSAPLGLSIIYRDLVNTLSKGLDQVTFAKNKRSFLKQFGVSADSGKSAPNRSVHQHLVSDKGCPACERYEEMERFAVTAVIQAISENDDKMLAALEQADGLCLPHLRQTLDKAPNQAALDALIAIQQKKLLAIRDELDEFIRKSDYRFQHEGFNSEADAWLRAMNLISGPPPKNLYQ
jgi:hypothetical protein